MAALLLAGVAAALAALLFAIMAFAPFALVGCLALAGAFLALAGLLAATGRTTAVGGVLGVICAAAGTGMAIVTDAGWTAAALAGGALPAWALCCAARRSRRWEAQDVSHGAGAVEGALPAGAPEVSLSFDPAGRVIAARGAVQALFGLDERALLQESALFDRIHVTDRVLYLQALGETRAGAASSECRIRVRRLPNGGAEFQSVSMRFAAVRGSSGRLFAIDGLAREADDVQAEGAGPEAAIRKANDACDAKSLFLASVSHELRTPLNAVIGFSEMLDQEIFGGFENPRQKEYVRLIRQSGEHLLAVVNGLLDMSKIEAGRYELAPERFHFDTVLRGAADLVRHEAERKGLTLEIRASSGGETIVADRKACRQMLLNLLSNAVKFTDSGAVTVESAVTHGRLVFKVSDTGIGIPAADIGRLGEPFTQLSHGVARRYEGTGLGLSLTRRLAELHGGEMRIASEFGKGTEVTITIPQGGLAMDHETTRTKIISLDNGWKTEETREHDGSLRRSA